MTAVGGHFIHASPAKMTPVLQVCAAASGHIGIGIVPKTYQNFGSLREYQMPIPSYNDEYFDDDDDDDV